MVEWKHSILWDPLRLLLGSNNLKSLALGGFLFFEIFLAGLVEADSQEWNS